MATKELTPLERAIKNAAQREWRRANPDKVKKYVAREKAKDPTGEKARERDRARWAAKYAKHRDKILAANAAWTKANPGKVREIARRSAASPRQLAYRKAYYANNRDKVLAKRAERYWADPEKAKAENNERARRTREKDPVKYRDYAYKWILWKKYRMTVDQFNAMVEAQDGVCAICGGPPQKRERLCVDHDHDTGAIRALLCGQCNSGIGLLGDDPARLEAAIAYLRAHKAKEKEA